MAYARNYKCTIFIRFIHFVFTGLLFLYLVISKTERFSYLEKKAEKTPKMRVEQKGLLAL